MSNKHVEPPFAGTYACPTDKNNVMITGSWRSLRPVVDESKCTQCLTCWISCPDACIEQGESAVSVNLGWCKGCGICTQVCPVGAITRVPELEFVEEAIGAASEVAASKEEA